MLSRLVPLQWHMISSAGLLSVVSIDVQIGSLLE